MMHTLTMKAAGLAALFALTACGSGGTATDLTYTPNSALFAAGSAPATLTVLALDRTSGNILPTQTTNLTPPNTLSGGLLTGTVSYVFETGATNTIALSGGKTASLEDNGTRYAFRFGNADMIGIAGVAASSMPSGGTVTYEGFADVIANDGSATVKLLTNASATASFDTNRMNLFMNNADGDWVRINDALISGDGYSSGNLSVSPSFATDPGPSGSLQHEGKFFEKNAKEIGGVLILDRTSAGIDFKIQGTYGATDGS